MEPQDMHLETLVRSEEVEVALVDKSAHPLWPLGTLDPAKVTRKITSKYIKDNYY